MGLIDMSDPKRTHHTLKEKKDVERQWDEEEYLTKCTDKPEFMGVIRKSEGVVVLWKYKNHY